MVYILSKNGQIKSFSDAPFSLQEGESQESLPLTVTEYQDVFKLSANKSQIIADGVDGVFIMVSTSRPLNVMSVDVDGLQVDVTLINGVGVLPLITSTYPTFITILPWNKSLFAPCGAGILTIEAI